MIAEFLCKRPALVVALVVWACLWTGIGLSWIMWRLEARNLNEQLRWAIGYAKSSSERMDSGLRMLMGVLKEMTENRPPHFPVTPSDDAPGGATDHIRASDDA
jgi:hypothetical protein